MPAHPNDNRRATTFVRTLGPTALLALLVIFDYELFNQPLPASIQPQEVLWTEFSLIGMLFQVQGLWDAIDDFQSLRRDGRNGARKIVAQNAMRNQFVACTMHVLFMMVGVVAMTQRPVNPNQPITVTGVVLTFVLFGANAILVANAVLQRRSRAKLERYIEASDGFTMKRVSNAESASPQSIDAAQRGLVREGQRQTAEGDRQTREGERQTEEGKRQTVEGQRLDQRRTDMDEEENG